MKVLSALPSVLLTAFLICCSATHPGTEQQGKRPGDFSVEYQWREASVPPPYHYEYSVTIKPTGQGQIAFVPDYPSEAPPRWVESFVIEEGRLDDLYRVMLVKGLFTRKWRQMDPLPVGGSFQQLSVKAGGKRLLVEEYLVAEQEAAARAIYAAVRALVPEDIWESLQVRRQQYMQEHGRK
ncbi:MAG: hypothetical protein AB1427_20440 [Thermodesulfobacteriota bacterium]